MQPDITGSRIHAQCAVWSCTKLCKHVSVKLHTADQICYCPVLHTSLRCWLPFVTCLSGLFTALYNMPSALSHGALDHACWPHSVPFEPCQLGALTALCTMPTGLTGCPLHCANWGHSVPFAPRQLGALTAFYTMPIGLTACPLQHANQEP